MNELTRHILYAHEDYELLEKLGIKTVREGIGWRLVENNGQFDFAVIESRARAANELGLQVNWTFCHYGWPNDINVFSEAFIDRFAIYCERIMQYLKPFSDLPTIFSPINEISFLSWAVSQNYFSCSGMENPYCSELKHQLVRAALKGCEVIWENDPTARILHCDPLIHVVAPSDQPSLEEIAFMERQAQFDAWDMLCGLKEPQLGGKPHFLDLVGVNYCRRFINAKRQDNNFEFIGYALRICGVRP